MFWWWIADVVLIAAVLPVVLVLLNRILGPIEEIRFTVDDIYRNAVTLYDLLDGVPDKLAETDETVRQVGIGATRYEEGLERLITDTRKAEQGVRETV